MRYNEIKEIYDELAKKEKRYEYFQVRLLKQVALELQNIIDTIDTEELNYYVTKHYSTRLTIDHIRYANGLLRPPQGITHAIKQYFVANLVRVKEYLDVELEDTDCTIEAFPNVINAAKIVSFPVNSKKLSLVLTYQMKIMIVPQHLTDVDL